MTSKVCFKTFYGTFFEILIWDIVIRNQLSLKILIENVIILIKTSKFYFFGHCWDSLGKGYDCAIWFMIAKKP